MQRQQAPFRADIVGSFLRPDSIKQARQQLAEGIIDAGQLREIENNAIRHLVQQQCEQDGERSLDDQRADHDLEGMQNCRLERGILKRCDVVLETNEFTCLGGKSVALPLIEAVISTQDDRQNHKADEQKNRRCGQYENLNITTHFAIGRFLGPLSAQRHRVFACT